VAIVLCSGFVLDGLNVSVLREDIPNGEFWAQVGHSNVSRSHPSKHESYRGDFTRGVFVNSFSISGIQDVLYKMKVSEFDENLSTCPVYLNHYGRMFGYLQLRVNPLVDVEGSQTRPGRIETANQGIPSFTHCMGSLSSLRWFMLREAVRTRHDKHSLRLARKAAQTQPFTTTAESEIIFEPM
jgi:hypothetical protein